MFAAIVIAVLAILLGFGFASFKIIGQAEVMVIERLGRFHRVARSGLNILIPFIERPRSIDVRYFEVAVGGGKKITAGSTTRIDLREQVLNFPSQPVITKDNVTIDIDAVLYYRVADPQKATYAVQNLPYALETLTRTTLRNIVGEMELDATLASRDAINTRMREVIEEAAIGWGVDLTRVELQAIEPPRDIQQSMELQMRAAILESEGVREAQVRRAEGEKDAAILRAQGQATARLAMAEAEAQALGRIAAALPEGEAAMYLLGVKYLEALPKMTEGAGTTIFLPAEATGVMGAIGGLRELLVRSVTPPSPGGAPRGTARANTSPASPPAPPQLGSGARRRDPDDDGPDGPPLSDL